MADVTVTIGKTIERTAAPRMGATHTERTPDAGTNMAVANALLAQVEFHNQHLIGFGGLNIERTGTVVGVPNDETTVNPIDSSFEEPPIEGNYLHATYAFSFDRTADGDANGFHIAATVGTPWVAGAYAPGYTNGDPATKIYIVYSVRVGYGSSTAVYTGIILSNTTVGITLLTEAGIDEAFFNVISGSMLGTPSAANVRIYKHVFRFDDCGTEPDSAIESRLTYIRDTLGRTPVITVYGAPWYALWNKDLVAADKRPTNYTEMVAAGPRTVWIDAIAALAYACAKRYGLGGQNSCNVTRYMIWNELKGMYQLARVDGATFGAAPPYTPLLGDGLVGVFGTPRTATSYAAGTLTETGAFAVNAHVGKKVIHSSGKWGWVKTNTADVLTLDANWIGGTPSGGTYEIENNGTESQVAGQYGSFYGAFVYTDLYKRCYCAIKAAQPGALVGGPYAVMHDKAQLETWRYFLRQSVACDFLVVNSTAGNATGGHTANYATNEYYDVTNIGATVTYDLGTPAKLTDSLKNWNTAGPGGGAVPVGSVVTILDDVTKTAKQSFLVTAIDSATVLSGSAGWFGNELGVVAPANNDRYSLVYGSGAGLLQTTMDAAAWFGPATGKLGALIAADLATHRAAYAMAPRVMAEYYFETDLQRHHAWPEDFQAALGMVHVAYLLRSGIDTLLRWQPMGRNSANAGYSGDGFKGNQQSLVYDARGGTFDGGSATPLYAPFVAAGYRLNGPIYAVTNSDENTVIVLPMKSWMLIVNRRNATKTASVDGKVYTLAPYEIKYVERAGVRARRIRALARS